MKAQYLIGIDLGTTNSAVAFVDLDRQTNPSLSIKNFPIPQIGTQGKIEHLLSLPSYCYLIPEGQQKKYDLPWKKNISFLVGKGAWEEGVHVPTCLIHSAKSWLSHPHAIQKSALLPENAHCSIERISPLEASARYLAHIREAWNYQIAKGNPEKEFEAQEIVLTIPASFDETARELTLEAAREAGYKSVVLLEEPQAAFYCWMARHEKHLQEIVADGDSVLVIDVGGGTTDFSLIDIHRHHNDLRFDRVAVGNHLLLGGDNIDAAIAHTIQGRLRETNDFPDWLNTLKFSARQAKEVLLSEQAPSSYTVLLQGRGASVVRKSQKVELQREVLIATLLEGFFGQYSFEEACKVGPKKALKAFGLPYEEDPSITRQLAQFLKKAGKRPTKVLFNGGTIKPKIFRDSILRSLNRWFSMEAIEELETESYDYAVAKGAAHFAKAKQGYGQRIGGGSPRAYYVEVNHEGHPQALTLLERGSDEEVPVTAPFQFHLIPNTPVTFRVFTSHTRLNDHLGSFCDFDPAEMLPLPPLQTVLKFGKTKELIPVCLTAKLTTIGVLELLLQAKNSHHQWKLSFNSGADNALTSFEKKTRIDETYSSLEMEEVTLFLKGYFYGGGDKEKLMEGLEKILSRPRGSWPISLIRQCADVLLEEKKEPRAIGRFWNALGFFLRPGFGFPLDEHRIKEIWKLLLSDFAKKSLSDDVRLQKWIFYRRIAGGLNKGQQARIAQDLPLVSIKNRKLQSFKHKQEIYLFGEQLRTLASLEWLDLSKKVDIGYAVLKRILSPERQTFDIYALGRLGARQLMYAPFTQVIDHVVVEEWLNALFDDPTMDVASLERLCMQLAGFTHHEHLNVSTKMRERILDRFPKDQRLNEFLNNDTVLSSSEQELFFADQLPVGLILKQNRNTTL
ncbi:MAG: Hsp70 family protein [Parachlamydiaceae bacterium]